MIFFLQLFVAVYVLGAVALAVANVAVEVDNVGAREAFSFPVLKASALFGILWPYYSYMLIKED